MKKAWEKGSMISEIDKVTKIVEPFPHAEDDVIDLEKKIAGYYKNVDEEIAYIISYHFSKISSEDIDFMYIDRVAPEFENYREKVWLAVDSHATSFGFESMDIMDRVLFILWYIEYDLLETPKEVLLNEMVELGKRYGDDASPKLLNGIGHKILMDIDIAKWRTPKAFVKPNSEKIDSVKPDSIKPDSIKLDSEKLDSEKLD